MVIYIHMTGMYRYGMVVIRVMVVADTYSRSRLPNRHEAITGDVTFG